MSRSKSHWNRRRGLAPVELVLWLPILLFVAALMVNFGTSATWRLRGEVVARDAAWRVRWPRTGANEPRPENWVWPKPARMEVRAGAPITQLENPMTQHPVVRGPLPNDFIVGPILDPDRSGALTGESEIDQRFPMLSKLGKFESGNIQHSLLDQKWSVAQLGIRTNETRRIPYIYQLPKADESFASAVLESISGLFAMLGFDALNPLDKDEDLRQWIGYSPDFHPRVNSRLARTDVDEVYEATVQNLVDKFNSRGEVELGQISHLPRTMTDTFLRLFRQAIADREQRIASLEDQITSGEAQIDSLNSQVKSLQSQISTLQSQLSSGMGNAQTQSDLANAQSQLAAAQGQISATQAAIDAARNEIPRLQDEIAQIEPHLEPLESYQGRLGSIEDYLKNAAAEYLNAIGK